MFERAVVGPFGIVGKAAAGKLPALEVIAETFAAQSLARTGVISAVT
jgi:hypothetical protein